MPPTYVTPTYVTPIYVTPTYVTPAYVWCYSHLLEHAGAQFRHETYVTTTIPTTTTTN